MLLLELGDLIEGYDSVLTEHTVKICISLSALLHEHDNALFTSWPPKLAITISASSPRRCISHRHMVTHRHTEDKFQRIILNSPHTLTIR